MLHFQQNYFERQTELLGKIEVRQEIMIVYKISAAMASYSFNTVLDLIQNFKVLKESNSQGQLQLSKQVELAEAFCYYHLEKIERTKEICLKLLSQIDDPMINMSHLNQTERDNKSMTSISAELHQSFSVRVITFMISLQVQGQKVGIKPLQLIQRLIKLLRVNDFIYLPQVLGTLTGCKYLKLVEKMKIVREQNNQKRAKKYEIVSNWKFLVNQKDDCIKFKQNALQIWQSQNLLQQSKKCQSQLQQLSTEKGKFFQKLKRLHFFIQHLYVLQTSFDETNKQALLKWCILPLIQQIQSEPQQEKKKQRYKNQSKLQNDNMKKEQLKQIINQCKTFQSSYKVQINGEITNLIKNSHFIDENVKKVRKVLVIFSKVKKYYIRTFIMLLYKYVVEKEKHNKGKGKVKK